MMHCANEIRWSRQLLIQQLALGHSKSALQDFKQDFKLAATASLALSHNGVFVLETRTVR